MAPLLLDTCAVIWVANDEAITEAAAAALDEAYGAGEPVLVSPITAWEIGMLAALRRLRLPVSPQRWFQRLLEAPGVALAPLPPELLIESSFLPRAEGLRDPADRIVVATARAYGHRLVTRDRRLLDYAALGHVLALEC